MKFMVTFVLLFFAFMVGLHNLYWYYDAENVKSMEIFKHNLTTRAEKGFGT